MNEPEPKACDSHCHCEVPTNASHEERRILIIVLIINFGMFLAEFTAGLASRSTALLADSLDMLADAFIYAIGLYALYRAAIWRPRGALISGSVQLLLGIGVFIEAISKLAVGAIPDVQTMGIFGVLALIANTICFLLLYRFRDGEINLRATWICSRNDMLGNVGVLLAAGLVSVTGTAWPDIIIGLIIAWVVIHSAIGIIRQARQELAKARS